jgi:hypothetical protein
MIAITIMMQIYSRNIYFALTKYYKIHPAYFVIRVEGWHLVYRE